MSYISHFLIGFVALIHIYILIIEMFLWTKKKGIKTFGLKSREFAEETKVMGANQGLYNGFLAAGLIYAMFTNNKEIALIFLTFVFIAGVFGAFSLKNKKILYIQTVPAILAMASIFTMTYSL